jgi:hypothetical protein
MKLFLDNSRKVLIFASNLETNAKVHKKIETTKKSSKWKPQKSTTYSLKM